jgi:hypothetical protein
MSFLFAAFGRMKVLHLTRRLLTVVNKHESSEIWVNFSSLPISCWRGQWSLSCRADLSPQANISKGKVVPVLNLLSTMPLRPMGKCMYKSTNSWRHHWMNIELHAPVALLPGKKSPYPLDRRLVELQNWSGRRGEEWNLPLQRYELRPFGRPASSQSLYRLRYLDT